MSSTRAHRTENSTLAGQQAGEPAPHPVRTGVGIAASSPPRKPFMPAPDIAESTVTRNAVVILAVISGGATLYWMAPILTPLALAMFLAVMIDGFARVLQHRLPHVSERAAMPLAVVISLLLFGGTAFFVATNATEFASEMVGYTPRL